MRRSAHMECDGHGAAPGTAMPAGGARGRAVRPSAICPLPAAPRTPCRPAQPPKQQRSNQPTPLAQPAPAGPGHGPMACRRAPVSRTGLCALRPICRLECCHSHGLWPPAPQSGHKSIKAAVNGPLIYAIYGRDGIPAAGHTRQETRDRYCTGAVHEKYGCRGRRWTDGGIRNAGRAWAVASAAGCAARRIDARAAQSSAPGAQAWAERRAA